MSYPLPPPLKTNRLIWVLFASMAMNVAVLALLSYWNFYEKPPTPYCELKPVEQGDLALTLSASSKRAEVLAQFSRLSFDQLVEQLRNEALVEDGYRERDLALGALVAFHDFDIARSVPPGTSLEKRIFTWKRGGDEKEQLFTLYPRLDGRVFEVIQDFAKREAWPMTARSQFLLLQQQKAAMNIDPKLAEAFLLSSEFWKAYLLFSRGTPPMHKEAVLEILLEGNWDLLGQFAQQQQHANDLSNGRRQKFLLDYIRAGSQAAAVCLLKTDWEFAEKKLDDTQVVALLQLLSVKTAEGTAFAKQMLTSPRSKSVWQQASLRLYEYAGEPIPTDWNYANSLRRFAPEYVREPIKAPLKQVIPPPPPKELAPPTRRLPAFSPVKKTPLASPPMEKVYPALKKEKPAVRRPRLYIVQQGDSLWKISRRFEVEMQSLIELNRLQSTSLKPGAVLKIPTFR